MAIRFSPDGPFVSRLQIPSLNQGSTATKAVLEASTASQFVADRAVVPVPVAGLPAGFMLSHGRVQGGSLFVGMGNLNAPGPDDPAAVTWAVQQVDDALGGASGEIAYADAEVINVNSGAAIAANSVGNIPIVAGGMLVSPRGALPAGLAYSHQIDVGGTTNVALANLTGAPIVPGAIDYNVARIVTAASVTPPSYPTLRRGSSGRRALFNVGASVDHGNIPANSALSATFTVAGVTADHIAFASPRAALPAGLAYSHCICAADSVGIVLANMTGAPVNPASIDWDVLVVDAR